MKSIATGFGAFADAMSNHINEMMERYGELFVVDMEDTDLAEIYLDAIPESENPIFVTNRKYDCSCCKTFLRRLGPVVAITDDLKVITIFDFEVGGFFDNVLKKLSKAVREKAVVKVFRTMAVERTYGCKSNSAVIFYKPHEFHHFYFTFDKHSKYVCADPGAKQRTISDMKVNTDAFERALTSTNPEAVDTVLDICKEGALYRGDQWITSLESFKKAFEEFNKLDSSKEKHLWCMKNANTDTYISCCRIMNCSIGVLIEDISSGMNVEEAVKKYEKIVAPENYKRPKPVYTKKMLQSAKEKLNKMGLLGSLKRRFATIDDISVNDVLYINRDVMKTALAPTDDIFAELSNESVVNPKSFENIPAITFAEFMSNIIPDSSKLEIYFANSLKNSLVSLIAPEDKSAPGLFNWNNPYCWAYTGNITDSSMKERVRAAGGNVDCDLRFSLQWNDIPNKYDGNDLDAHCTESYFGSDHRQHIYFGHKRSDYTCGFLDIDIRRPGVGIPAVENISYMSRKNMRDGQYAFHVVNYAYRGGNTGFRAEIEFDGNVYYYDYKNPVLQEEIVSVAGVTLRNGEFTITHALKPTNSSVNSIDVWGVKTCTFLPVSVIMNSPNYWPNSGFSHGNKHIFFIIPGMVNDENPNGFYNEFLKSSLNEHRHVMEALGEKLSVAPADRQLSGIGCSVTKHKELIMRVNGKRVYKVKI